jgi:hypothetical protein
MAENTAIDTVQDDELVDEALDRTRPRACAGSWFVG